MKSFLAVLCILVSVNAFAKFGGSRSGGFSSRSSSSRSFGGSRSYSSPRSSMGSSFFGGNRSGYTQRSGSAPITRPAPAAPSTSSGSYGPRTTIVNNHDSSFFHGMLFGSWFGGPRTTVIAPGGGYVDGAYVGSGVGYAPGVGVSYTHSALDIFFSLIIWGLLLWFFGWIGLICYRMMRDKNNGHRKGGARHDW